MKIPKKAALICALVMLISVVPAFALNQTDNTTTTDQTQGQNCTGNQNKYQGSQGSCDSAGKNCGSCDGDQHQYQYGQGNSNSGTGICDGTNCKKSS